MSKIEWTERTWNPIVGCSVLSPGCTNCYAMRMAARLERMGVPQYAGLTKPSNAGPVWTGKVGLVERALTLPLRTRKPTTWFVNSMSDLFHEDVPDAWIDRVFGAIGLSAEHTYQILTKRSARMRRYMTDPATFDRVIAAAHAIKEATGRGDTSAFDWPMRHIWLGVSAEDQRRADERVPDLLATPAVVRFVSAEPLLGPLRFDQIRRHHHGGVNLWDALTGFQGHGGGGSDGNARLDWIIVGGESGPGARPMHPHWARQIRDQCAAAGVPYHHKQNGEWGTVAFNMSTGLPVFREFRDFQHWVNKASTWVRGGICLDSTGQQLHRGADFMRARDEDAFPVTIMHRVGKKAAGRLLDGVEHNGMPEIRHGG